MHPRRASLRRVGHSIRPLAGSTRPAQVRRGLLAVSGPGVWIAYLIADRDMLAWIALATLGAVALLGLTMLGRWIMVRRAIAAALRARPRDAFGRPRAPLPAESRFPIPVVVAHGVLAVSTITLALLTILTAGGS